LDGFELEGEEMQQNATARPRDVMPQVWRKIGEYSQKWGKAHVTECIQRGMAGEPGWFYAFEAGHVAGTPFTADEVVTQGLHLAVALGGRFAVVMRPPVVAPRAAAGGDSSC
jgi:hypothetical protein